jgi:protocatechuate 3,4-dioxygenase beta subunit
VRTVSTPSHWKPLSRRRALGASGVVGLGALIASCARSEPSTTTAAVPTTTGGSATVLPQTTTSAATTELFGNSASCTLTPQETEGPYYFNVDSIRGDIREDRPGTPLRLAMRVQDAACAPIANSVVDIWHCDAGGSYSGFESASQGGPGGGRTDQKTYLRGAQVTNADGIVQFATVYPGWYRGRTVHIHFKVHLDKRTLLTSQLYFDENVTSKVYTQAPYSVHTGRDRFNRDDSIFDDSLIMTLREETGGYLGIMSVNVAK